jgi:hypothetical protein
MLIYTKSVRPPDNSSSKQQAGATVCVRGGASDGGQAFITILLYCTARIKLTSYILYLETNNIFLGPYSVQNTPKHFIYN